MKKVGKSRTGKSKINEKVYQTAIVQNEIIKLVMPELHRRLEHIEEMVETLVLWGSVGAPEA